MQPSRRSFLLNHQPAKALPYFLRLRRPDVFDLIRQHNLFSAVQDQVLLLVEFDMELDDSPEKVIGGNESRRPPNEKLPGGEAGGKHGRAIELLVDHVHSIPVRAKSRAVPLRDEVLTSFARQIDRVTKQLAAQPKYLYMYLDCLFSHDPHIVSAYGNQHVSSSSPRCSFFSVLIVLSYPIRSPSAPSLTTRG